VSDLVEHATTRRRFELFLDNNQLFERSTRRELIAIIVTCIAAKDAADWTGRLWPARPAWAAFLTPTLSPLYEMGRNTVGQINSVKNSDPDVHVQSIIRHETQ